MRILAVDDDKVFLDLLVPMLRALGQMNVTTALSAADALVLLEKMSPGFDCILLDIQMPGMDGVDLCRAVRSIPDYSHTPIVMITAMSTRKYIDDAFSAGATDYVTKPLDQVDLKARLGMVERLLTERQCADALASQFDQRADVLTQKVDFETPFLVPGFDRSIEFLALENYLLTLGKKQVHSMSAMAIHVRNADVIFGAGNAAGFVNMLGDVASVISDAFKMDQMIIAYAGGGDFIGVFDAPPEEDPALLEQMITDGVNEFSSIYAEERLPLPQIKVGPLVRCSLLAALKPTSFLHRAMDLARVGREPKARFWWSAA